MMYRLMKLLLLIGALVLTDGVTWWVLCDNLDAGIYMPDRDSIILPILGAVFLSMIAFPFVVMVGLFNLQQVWGFLKQKHVVINALIVIGYGCCLLVCFGFAILGFIAWAFEYHWPIALSYMGFATVLAGYVWHEFGVVRR